MMAHYYCSDLHLRGLDDGGRSESFLRFIETRCGDAERLTILGDLFDFSLSYQLTLYRPFYPIYRALERLQGRGVEVRVFCGNHDPDPDSFLAHELGIPCYRDAHQEELYGRHYHLCHGDLLEPSWRRRALCQLARSPRLIALVKLLPPALAWRLALAYGGHDPEHDAAPERPQWSLSPQLLDSLWSALETSGAETLIVGHYHRVAQLLQERNKGGEDSKEQAEIFVLGEWLNYRSYLRIDEVGRALYRFQGGAWEDDERYPPGEHDPP